MRFWSRIACTQPRIAHLLADLRRQLARSVSASSRGPYPSTEPPSSCARLAGRSQRLARLARARPRRRTPRPRPARAARSSPPQQVVLPRAPAPAGARRVSRTSTRADRRAHRPRAPADLALRTSRSTSAVTSSASSSRRAVASRRRPQPPTPPRQLARRRGQARGAPSPPATTTTPPRTRTAGTARTGAGRPTATGAARGSPTR